VADASLSTVTDLMSLGFIAIIARLDEAIPSITYKGVELAPSEPTPCRRMLTALSPASPDEDNTLRPET